MQRMTMRERMLALVQGREHDQVPFAQYKDTAAPDEDVWALIGRENMGIIDWTYVHRLETPNCRFETEEILHNGKRGSRRTLFTPEGVLYEERLYEPAYGSSSPMTHFVKEPKDYRVLMAYFRDIKVHKHLEPFLESLDALGEDGLPQVHVSRSPFQQLWVEWVGMQDLAVHMMSECPELMDEVFAVMSDVQHRIFEVVCEAATEVSFPYVNFPDNITAPMIGNVYFETYCAAAYNELASMLDDTGRDVPVFVHMDGDLEPLWDAIGATRVRGLDSMSPPPDNDTSVAEAVSRWPEMRVWANYPSSVHLASQEEVYRQTMAILEEGGHSGRLQIQISENVPPGVWQNSLPQIVKAIKDFGPVHGT